MIHYAITIFLSAFLLFQVQPLIGKFILPWFGGTPAVWATCMLFFQVLLLLGYSYAHLVSTALPPRAVAVVHVLLLLASLVFLPVTPSDGWKPEGSDLPVLRILGLMLSTVSVGAPSERGSGRSATRPSVTASDTSVMDASTLWSGAADLPSSPHPTRARAQIATRSVPGLTSGMPSG